MMAFPPNDSFRASLDRFLAYFGSALNFTPTAVDYAQPIPIAIVDLSSSLPGLMPGSDTFTKHVPLVLSFSQDLAQILTDRALASSLNNLHVPSGALVIVFPFIEDEVLELHREMITRKSPYQLTRTIVLIGRSDLVRILTNTDPLREFRKLVLEQIEIEWIAPYQEGGPVRDHGFFGRQHELGRIVSLAREQSFLIIGGRRIGKSSLLHRLCETSLPQASITTLLLDCQGLVTIDDFQHERILSWWPDPPVGAPNTVAELLDSPPSNVQLMVLIDEVDRLVELDRPKGWKVSRRLRALSQRPRSRIQFVLAGERALDAVIRDDPDGPYYNFGTRLLLGCLEFRAVESMVVQPMRQMGIDFEDELGVVRMIFDYTAGHPNVVQRLCLRLLRLDDVRLLHRITLADVRSIIDDTSFQHNDFLNVLWEKSTRLERIISLVMADHPEANTKDLMLKAMAERCHVEPTETQVTTALRSLVELRSILKQSSGGYAFAIEAFPSVVAKTIVLHERLRELSEQFRQYGNADFSPLETI